MVEEDGGTPPVKQVEFWIVAVVTLAVGFPEEDLVGKQDGMCCNLDVRVPEKEVV